MKVIKKIKINIQNGKSRMFKFLNIPILQFDKINGSKTNFYIPILKKYNINKNKPIFYLKVNRRLTYTFYCLQQWINVVSELNADFYIICDNEKLKQDIYNRIIFKNTNIKFLKSCKRMYFKKFVKNAAIKKWRNAAYAHLTTYIHSKKHNIKSFWNIDADDTLLLIEPCKLAEILDKISNYANKNNIDNFSLDMWRSQTRGKHWTFGVTYTQNNNNWLNLFKDCQGINWRDSYKNYNIEYNLDWFFTYLLDYKKINNQTFYIENSSFIHYGEFLVEVIKSGIYKWENGKLYYPLLLEIFKDKELGIIPIADDCIKFDFGIKHHDCLIFAQDNIAFIKDLKKDADRLWGAKRNE